MEFDPVQSIADWLRSVLVGWNFSEVWTDITLQFIGAFVVALIVMLIALPLIWVERKGSARIQDRIGPNRVGPFGLIQVIADMVKIFTKEDTTPRDADKVVYNLAPILAPFSVIMVWAVIPWTSKWMGADLNVGILYIAAVGSFGILSTLMAGWSSNNKFALLGAVRGVAQLISYEIPLFLAMLVPVFLARSMGVNDIVEAQSDGGVWFILIAPLAAVFFFISSLAETARAPFDLLEADSEIVAGYQVEYSGIKFGMFYVAEFLHTFTAAAMMSILFFGGWDNPFGADRFELVGLAWFLLKTSFFYFVILWIRMTFPRVRIDQLMNLNWKFMVPASLIMIMAIPILDYLVRGQATWVQVVVMSGFSLLFGLVLLLYASRSARKNPKQRVRFEGRPLAVPPKEEETSA